MRPGTQRERWPASVSSRIAATSSSSAASTRPFAAKTSAQHVRQNARSVTWSYRLTNSSRTLLHCCGLLGVAGPLTGEHQGAADVGERLETCRLTACRGGHSLVEVSESLINGAQRDLGETELGERAQLEVGVARPQRDVERLRCQARRLIGVSSLLGTRQIKPPLLGARRYVAKQALGPSEPTTRSRVVSERECVFARKPECDSRSARELAVASKTGVRSLARNDGIALLAEPPEGATEPVERLRELLDRERAFKRRAGRRPVARGECLVALGNRRLRRSRSHS